MTFLAALVGTVALLNDILWRVVRSGLRFGGGGGGGRRGGGKDGGGGAPIVIIVLVLWVLSWLLAPIVTQMMALAVSRKREYLADASAAQFTRNPGALADALAAIHSHHGATRAIGRGVAHLCIDDPLGRRLDDREGRLADLFATHPPMAIRVARLRAMARRPAA
jgi:heat shock protein HtpX